MAKSTIADLYLKVPRRVRMLIAFILIVLAVYLFIRIIVPANKSVPDEFLKARQQSAIIAKDIVGLSSQTSDNIKNISDLDKEQKYQDALKLVSQEIEHNREARQKAIDLSVQLEAMAKNVSKISPTASSQEALQAISSETALISHLINYNDYLVQLLEILNNKFSGEEKDADGKIADLITKINTETQTINELNSNFNDLMNRVGE